MTIKFPENWQLRFENLLWDLKKLRRRAKLTELSEEDKPLVIGKGGRNIRAIRQITSILARKEDKRIYIKIAD